MARHPILRNGGDLASRHRIDNPECLVAFIRDKQQPTRGFIDRLRTMATGDRPHAENSEQGKSERTNDDAMIGASPNYVRGQQVLQVHPRQLTELSMKSNLDEISLRHHLDPVKLVSRR